LVILRIKHHEQFPNNQQPTTIGLTQNLVEDTIGSVVRYAQLRAALSARTLLIAWLRKS